MAKAKKRQHPDHGHEQMGSLVERWLMVQRCDLIDALGPCESPMETLLCLALLVVGDSTGPFLRLCDPPGRPWARGRTGDMHLQHPLSLGARNIRIDIAILGKKKLAVEVDGAEFHNSRKQIDSDTARDKLLTAEGWTPVRFTGAEVNSDAARCAERVVGLLDLRVGVEPPASLIMAAVPKDDPALSAAEARGDIEAVNAILRATQERARKRMGLHL